VKVTIRYLAQIRHAAGTSCEPLDVARGDSARQLVAAVARRRGDRFAEALLGADGTLRTSVLLFVGDRQIASGEDVALKDGDEITLLSPIGGG
jgi:molybdopterin converting factor small subunit